MENSQYAIYTIEGEIKDMKYILGLSISHKITELWLRRYPGHCDHFMSKKLRFKKEVKDGRE